MARVKGILKLSGSVGKLTFVNTKNGCFVREKSDAAKDKVYNSPGSAGTRKNMSELTNYTQANHDLKAAFHDAIKDVKVGGTHNRLGTVLSAVKNTDTIHPTGWRSVATGILNKEGKALLRNFDFNHFAPLHDLLLKDYSLNMEEGTLIINSFNPANDLNKPQAASKAGFSLYWARVDFESREYNTVESGELVIGLDDSSQDINLSIPIPPTGSGVVVFVLRLVFYQEVSGQLYRMNNREFRSAKIVGVV